MENNENVTTASKQNTPESPAKKPGRPKKATPKQEAPETPAKKPGRPKKVAPKQEASEAPAKAPEQAVPTSQDEQESLIREILRNQREMFQAISTLLNKKENEGKEDMKTNNTTAPNPTPAPTTAPNPGPGPTTTSPTNRMQSIWNWLRQPFTRPRWVWVCLSILCCLLLLIALALRPTYSRIPQRQETTVVAQSGSIAVGGNVTISVTPDRYVSQEGTATEMSISRPLISMNYGKEDNTKDTIKLDGVTVVPEQIEVLDPDPVP